MRGIDLTGRRFSRLLVLTRVGSKRIGKTGLSRHQWQVKCNCGTIKIVDSTSLLNGHTISCGCYKNERIAKQRQLPDKTMAAKNNLYTSYKRGAKYKNQEFSLFREDFDKLTQANCFYC